MRSYDDYCDSLSDGPAVEPSDDEAAAQLDDEIAALESERDAVHDQITNLYWTFTRTAKGKPPCVVRPDLYERRAQLADRIRALKNLSKEAA